MSSISRLPHGSASLIRVPWQKAPLGTIHESALQITRMPMVMTDPNQPDNPIVFTNPAFLSMVGYDESEVIGRNCRFLQGPDTDPATVQLIRDGIANETPVNVQIINYRKPKAGYLLGEPFLNALYMEPFFDDENKLLYFFASQMDVTAERAAEAAMIKAQRMDALGALSAGVAHDLNNMLAFSMGHAEIMLTDTDLKVRQQKNITLLIEGMERAARLVQQLLAFGRQQTLHAEPTKINDLVLRVLDMGRSVIGSTIRLTPRMGDGLKEVHIDQAKAEQAIYNLLLNAQAAMPRGGSIVLETQSLSVLENNREAYGNLAPGDYVVLSITDTGAGMPPDVLARATEPFFTTKSLAGEGRGHGMGLAQVQGFAQQSEGWLEIQSEVNRGTTCRLYFPAALSAANLNRELPGMPALMQVPRQTYTVLLVEDDKNVLEMTTNMLEMNEYKVLPATDAQIALLTLRSNSMIDLVITDYRMPGLTGVEFADEVRRSHPEIPVIILTGFAAPDILCDTPYEVISKPFRMRPFLDRVQQVIADHVG